MNSDTTASSLTFWIYCIAKHSEHADKARGEFAGVDSLDLDCISTLPHLNGAIHESMRLFPAVTTIITRETP